MGKDLRVITPSSCTEVPINAREALIIDLKRARFIVRKKFRVIAGSKRLGQLWLVIDPLIISLMYFLVFTVIRYNPDPRSLFFGNHLYPNSTISFKNGFNNSIDYTGGIKIERVSSRCLLLSEWYLIFLNTFFMCFGVSLLFLFIFDSNFLDIIVFFALAIILYVMWYGLGSFFSPIGRHIPDTKSLVSYFGMLMFFASPALYSLGETQGHHRSISLINPFSFIVEACRLLVLNSEDFYLLDTSLGLVYGGLFLSFFIFSILRFDRNRWRFSTWS